MAQRSSSLGSAPVSQSMSVEPRAGSDASASSARLTRKPCSPAGGVYRFDAGWWSVMSTKMRSRTRASSTMAAPSAASPKSEKGMSSWRTAMRARKLSTSLPSYSLVPVTPTSASRPKSTGASCSACRLIVATTSAVMWVSHTLISAASGSLPEQLALPAMAFRSALASAPPRAWSLEAASAPSGPSPHSSAAYACTSRMYHSFERTVGFPAASRNWRPYEPAWSSVLPRAVSAKATRDSSATCRAQAGRSARYCRCCSSVRVSALLASST
mmetsp:Transcript_16211/g.49277  ORF Transcript_16211/g.49277 Transcript_16211/m.49277 type:complete len:271 (-) Transcript_16211:595-1407(-)